MYFETVSLCELLGAFNMKKFGFIVITSALLIGSALAQQWPNVPIIGGSSYCSSTVNSVCVNTVPAGPTSVTGAETVPADTNLSSGQTPQTAKVTSLTLANYARGTGLLYSTGVPVAGIAGTTEQTLATYSIPASTLISGRMIRIKASFSAAANGNNKTFKCYFGASVISSGVLTSNAKNGSCEVNAFYTSSATTQEVYGNMLVDTTPITGYVNAGTDNSAAAIVAKFTAIGGTSGIDITLNAFSVELLGQ